MYSDPTMAAGTVALLQYVVHELGDLIDTRPGWRTIEAPRSPFLWFNSKSGFRIISVEDVGQTAREHNTYAM